MLPHVRVKTRQLVAEAGFPDGFEIYMALTEQPEAGVIPAAQAVATMWKDIGIRTRQEFVPSATQRPLRVNRAATGVKAYSSGTEGEPVRTYANQNSAKSGINQGFEHPLIGAEARRDSTSGRCRRAVGGRSRDGPVAVR